MANYPVKRARLNPGSHRDLLPLPHDAHSNPVQSVEPKLTRKGGIIRHGQAVRTAIEAPSSTWANLRQWGPVDDCSYALDPGDGEWYDEALEQDVMDVPRPPTVLPQKKYRRSRVSVCWK